MARIPTAELERLKAEVSVERLVEASGIVLSKSGKDRVGKCPFHEDGEPSLVVTPGKNLWHCFGCGVGGGPIDWMMKSQGISFRHAVERLKADLAVPSEELKPVQHSSARVIPPPVSFDADDQALLNQTISFYHETLKTSPEALDYLKNRGIDLSTHAPRGTQATQEKGVYTHPLQHFFQFRLFKGTGMALDNLGIFKLHGNVFREFKLLGTRLGTPLGVRVVHADHGKVLASKELDGPIDDLRGHFLVLIAHVGQKGILNINDQQGRFHLFLRKDRPIGKCCQ